MTPDHDLAIRDIAAALIKLGAVRPHSWARVVDLIDSYAHGTPERAGAVAGARLVLLVELQAYRTLTPEQMAAAKQAAQMEVC